MEDFPRLLVAVRIVTRPLIGRQNPKRLLGDARIVSQGLQGRNQTVATEKAANQGMPAAKNSRPSSLLRKTRRSRSDRLMIAFSARLLLWTSVS